MKRLIILAIAVALGAATLTVGGPILAAETDNSVVQAIADVEPAEAIAARCTSLYSVAIRNAASFDTAAREAAKAVWTLRYGNFGGWTITNVIYNLNGSLTIYGVRPGTSLSVSAYCTR